MQQMYPILPYDTKINIDVLDSGFMILIIPVIQSTTDVFYDVLRVLIILQTDFIGMIGFSSEILEPFGTLPR
jgi:hypothetical protein